jgi:LemA protein
LSIPGWIALAVLGVPVIYVVFAFNRFVAYRNEVRNSWAQIDVQLGRRHDLIPKLVEAVKGYMKHEKELLHGIVEARASAMKGGTVAARSRAEDILTRLLDGLIAVWEKYPDLKSNRNVLELQRELSSTEDRIAYTRGHYNDIVANYNALVQGIPSGLVARVFGFGEHEFFQAKADERAAPRAAL